AYKSKITKDFYHMIFVKEEAKNLQSIGKISVKSEDKFINFSGKIIKDIHYRKARIFGPPLNDTLNYDTYFKKEELTGHFYTWQKVIQRNILFKKGDTVNPYIFAENGKLLRKLSFIENALIQVYDSGNDSVDVYIITKDVFPWAINADVTDLDNWNVGLKNVNVAGLGHNAGTGFLKQGDEEPYLQWDNLKYEIKNIRNTFINSIFSFSRNESDPFYQIQVNRSYIPFVVNWGMGLSISEYKRNITVATSENNSGLFELKYDQVDFWLGRQFPLFEKRNKNEFPFWIIPSFRIIKTNYQKRPTVTNSNSDYINKTDILFSIGISKQQYYRENYFYEYGKTEDLPYGLKVKFTGGYSFKEVNERTYLGLEMSYGEYFTPLGFFRLSNKFGIFLNNGLIEQGVFYPEIAYTTKALPIGNYHLRNFIILSYIKGIKRKSGESLSLNNENGLNGLNTDEIKGTDRLNGHLEFNMFTPLNNLGFRLSNFVGFDYGVIGNDLDLISNSVYFSLTLGVRIKNDFLVFGTYQLSFTWLPVVPAGVNDFQLSAINLPKYNFLDYTIGAPSFIAYH
ncbi:hypothetical protein ACFL6I_28345, partial [candidate division KSB1 bacterium]